MEETIFYSIRHAETVDGIGIGFRNIDESDQIFNEKEIICKIFLLYNLKY